MQKIGLGNYCKVLQKHKGDLILTSPPYNIGSQSPAKTGTRNAIAKLYDAKSYRGIREYPDSMPENEYQESQIKFLRWAAKHLNENGVVVYNHKPRRKNNQLIHPMTWFMKVPQLTLIEEIIWDRGSTHNHSNRMMWQQTERLYIFRRTDSGYPLHNTDKLNYRSDIWRLNRAKINGHNAPFPLDLAINCIETWSNKGSTVLDPYTGSGTTAIAAYKTDRNFFGSEIIPEYYEQATKRLMDEQHLNFRLAG